jgi:hypothetical protein
MKHSNQEEVEVKNISQVKSLRVFRSRNVVRKVFLMLVAGVIVLMSISAYALTIPEKLVYDLTWTGIKAGTAIRKS